MCNTFLPNYLSWLLTLALRMISRQEHRTAFCEFQRSQSISLQVSLLSAVLWEKFLCLPPKHRSVETELRLDDSKLKSAHELNIVKHTIRSRNRLSDGRMEVLHTPKQQRENEKISIEQDNKHCSRRPEKDIQVLKCASINQNQKSSNAFHFITI